MSKGVALVLVAAALFGVTIPVIQRFGTGLGPFVTAALLYAGAAVGSSRLARTRGEPVVRRVHVPRLLIVALFGSVLAPALLAWGLQRTSGATGALLLNFEAVLTLAFAMVLHREHVGRRVALAAAVMLAGGVLLVLPTHATGTRSAWGAVAVIGAVAAWALDNVLTRPLADLDTTMVVRYKALAGAACSALIAFVTSEPAPGFLPATVLLLTGLGGYGVSLRLYLGAQRRIGTGRTGSMFATAPFVGAAVASVLGERIFDWRLLSAAALFGVGAILHLTERHEHEHDHEALEHEHWHRHDDGHHEHPHEPFALEHSHWHVHGPTRHEHPHGEDLHHLHSHARAKKR